MGDDSFFATRNRLAAEGEELVLHQVSNDSLDLVSVFDVPHDPSVLAHRRKRTFRERITSLFEFESTSEGSDPVSVVWVPSGTYLILKGISRALQQRYGLEEEEGAVYLRPDTQDATSRGELRFNNGALVALQDLPVGQLVEVLSLAGTQPSLYEPELQLK